MAFPICYLVIPSLLLISVSSKNGSLNVEELIEKCNDLKTLKICDPDDFLKQDIREVRKEMDIISINSTCQSTACESKGCEMYIVINKKMRTNYKHNHLLEEAKRFATQLMEKLVSSGCENSFLLYYSNQDQVFYVVTENLVSHKLPSELIGEIALLNKKRFSSNTRDGLISLIRDFRLVFNGKYKRVLRFSEPKYQAAMLAGGVQSSTPLPLLTKSLALMLHFATYCHF